MSTANTKQPVSLLRSALTTIWAHPAILFPFCCIAFVQFLILEIIFFAPRYPLSAIFKPVIEKFEGPMFLHYPFNFIVFFKWAQSPWVQVPLFILIASFFVGMAVKTIDNINRGNRAGMGDIFRQTLGVYVHLAIAAVLMMAVMFFFSKLHVLVLQRAAGMGSTEGFYFLAQKGIILSAPYVNFLLSILVTALFAFMIPLIVIDKQNIFSAVRKNFQILSSSFWSMLLVILLPGLLYLPVMLLKANRQLLEAMPVPEMWVGVIVFGVVVGLFVDALQYTAITTYFLLRKEK